MCPPPDDVPLLPGEQWVLFDTGASCNALKVERDCPDYTQLVRPTRNSINGKCAESANGGAIKERGEVVVDLMVDGNPCQVNFRDMDVSMAICSGKALVAGGDTYAIIHRNGGTLKNIVTGR